MSSAAKPQDHRRAQREDVCYRCEVEALDGATFTALVVNISPYGCMMRAGQEPAPGNRVRFALPIAGQRHARIVWTLGGRIGLEFDAPIDVASYLSMLDQLSRSGDELDLL